MLQRIGVLIIYRTKKFKQKNYKQLNSTTEWTENYQNEKGLETLEKVGLYLIFPEKCNQEFTTLQ